MTFAPARKKISVAEDRSGDRKPLKEKCYGLTAFSPTSTVHPERISFRLMAFSKVKSTGPSRALEIQLYVNFASQVGSLTKVYCNIRENGDISFVHLRNLEKLLLCQ